MWSSPYSSISWRERAQQRDNTSKTECMMDVNDKCIICLKGDTSSKVAESNIGQKSEIIDTIPSEYVKCMSHPLNKGTLTVYDTHHSKCTKHIDSAMKSCKTNPNNDCYSLIEKNVETFHMCKSRGVVTTTEKSNPRSCDDEQALSIFTCKHKSMKMKNHVTNTRKIEPCIAELAYLNLPIIYDKDTGKCGTGTSSSKTHNSYEMVCERIK
tara:strand:+ start:824 stop:1456 length:633 start_codon:yes stop_codon:yes gene_type:complete